MVEDIDIKTTVSPFAVREGEIKVFDGNDKYISMNQIVHRINIGHITDIHFKILEIVNEFEFITCRQLMLLLQSLKVEVVSQDKLNNKLDQLVKCKILTRYYFNSEEGSGVYRVYCMEKMGKYLLNSRGVESKWQPTDNVKPVSLIKQRLAGNQAILAYLRKVKAYDSYTVKLNLKAKQIGKNFKPSGGSIKITKGDKSLNFIFEAVRRADEWEKHLLDKMKLYMDFYEHFISGDCGLERLPQIIFVCEDDKHMVETFKLLVSNKIDLPKVKMYFTTDLKQNEETITKSLTEFVLDEKTGKYKMKADEIKILN